MSRRSSENGYAARGYLLLLSLLVGAMAWVAHRYAPDLPGMARFLAGAALLTALFALAAPLRWVRRAMAMNLMTQDMSDR